MDIRYKSFVPRSKQDHRFDQLLHTTSSLTKLNYKASFKSQSTSPEIQSFSQRSPTQLSQSRKKVNVVTFKPDEYNELIAKSDNTANSSPTNSTNKDAQTNYDISKLSNSNIPSILRSSRLCSQKLDASSDNNTSLVDSASKLIAAKRKAARENIDSKLFSEETKKKFSPPYVPDSSIKRAVSPEILRPEPVSNLPHIDNNYPFNINKDRTLNEKILGKPVCLTLIDSHFSNYSNDEIVDLVNPPYKSISSDYLLSNRKLFTNHKNSEYITKTLPNLDNNNVHIESLTLNKFGKESKYEILHQFQEATNRNRSKPIINLKKNSKVSYNPRPWQNNLDDEFENHYKLKPENVIYQQSSQTLEIAPDLECFDIHYEHIDDYDTVRETNGIGHLNHDIDNRLNKSKDFQDTTNFYLHEESGLYTADKQYPTSTTSDCSLKTLDKEKFTVLKNVKEAHECQETGETQDLLDDVEYLIEGLKSNLQSSTRTLSIITLTSKCLSQSFKELLKAHGLLGKIFKYLDDAHKDESVAMCTAALFLVFARDKQPRLFDDDSLELLLKLPKLSKNQAKPSKESERVREKIRLLLNKLHHNHNNTHHSYISNTDLLGTRGDNDVKSQTVTSSSIVFHRSCFCCRHLKLNCNITTEDLVVECLLQLSSRKCVDWFKNQMRKLRGLDLICEQVTTSVEYLGEDLGPQNLDEFVMDRLYRLFNYMRFLEHMTFQNRDNQSYLVDYNDTILINHFWRCLKLCAANLSYQLKESQEKILIQACLLAILRLLANISHDNEWTSNQMGSCTGLLKLIFSCLLHLPRFMSSGKRFDLSVLALALLINLAEHCSENRLRMAHVSISRKRVACLGKCGQISDTHQHHLHHALNNKLNKKCMGFSFDDEVDEEDMDLEDDEDDQNSNPILNMDCDSSDIKINVLEALVKLFLRHDDRAKNNVLIEGEVEPVPVENNDDVEDNDNNDPKWRLVADKSVLKRNKSLGRSQGDRHRNQGYGMEFSESEDDASSDEGADVEFFINSKEEEEELQRKLSAAGQHMQDSVVSAYTALLLGCIIKGSSRFMERIREHLPSGKFRLLAFVLAKFLSILSLTSEMGKTGEESILEIVRLLEAQDQISNSLENEEDDLRVSRDRPGDLDEDDRLLLSSKPVYRKGQRRTNFRLRHSSSESPSSSSGAYCGRYTMRSAAAVEPAGDDDEDEDEDDDNHEDGDEDEEDEDDKNDNAAGSDGSVRHDE